MTNKTTTYYFTEQTQDAIIQYNESTDVVERNQIYRNYIEEPITKLVSFYANSFHRPYITDTIDESILDGLSHFHTIIHHYKKEKANAYSYFSVIMKNYFIRRNTIAYKLLVDTDTEIAIDDERNISSEVLGQSNKEDKMKFIEHFILYLETNIELLFINDGEKGICDTFIFFLKHSASYEDFNKKQLYHLIKERENVRALIITRTLKRINMMYQIALQHFMETDSLQTLNPNLLLTQTRNII